MSEYNLGTARGTIEIDYRGSGVDQATRGLGQVSDKATSSDEAIRKTGTGFVVAGAAIAGGLAVAINSAANFEKGLSGIESVSGATTAEMEAVRAKALQLGADTAYSASDAAAAMEELVKAGLSIPDVMNGAADATVALAAAGGVELPEAAAIAANAMNQFGLSAEQMPNIADKIAGAANASAIDVTDFGHSMAQAGAVANLAGLSFDDTALAITAMGNAGIKGSDAGTSLKTFLQNLQPQTEKQIGLMKELGLVTEKGGNQFFDASGKIKPMTEIAGVLGKSLKGMSDAQKTATLETLFGSDAIRAAAVIAGEGSAGMETLATSINKVKAADVAATRMGNLSGQVEQLKGSAETLAIGLGSVFIPVLNKIVGAVTEVVNWFTSLDSGTQKAIAITAAFTAGLLLFVGGLIKAVQAAQAMKVAMLALNGTFLANPITWIIIAIVALVAAIILLWKNSETFRNIVLGVWAAVKNAVAAVAAWFTGTLVPWFQSVWASIQTGLQAVGAFFSTIWNAIVSTVQTVVSFIATIITTYVNIWRTIITTALNFILAIWNGIWGLFGPLIQAVWNVISAIIEVAWAWISKFLSAGLNALKAIFSAVWGAIVAVVTFYVNGVKNIVTTVFNAVKGVVTTIWNAVSSFISGVWNTIYGTVSAGVERVKSVVSSVFNAVKGVVTSIWSSISSIMGQKMEEAKAKVTGVVDSIKSFFSGAGSWLYDAGKKIIGGLIDGIKSMIGNVAGAMNGIADKIRSFLPGSPIKEGPLKDHGWNQGRPGKQLVAGLADSIESDIDKVSRAFSGIEPNLTANLTTSDVAARLVPVSASSVVAPAPAPVQEGDSYQVTVMIDPKDLVGLQRIEKFVGSLRQQARQKAGV